MRGNENHCLLTHNRVIVKKITIIVSSGYGQPVGCDSLGKLINKMISLRKRGLDSEKLKIEHYYIKYVKVLIRVKFFS